MRLRSLSIVHTSCCRINIANDVGDESTNAVTLLTTSTAPTVDMRRYRMAITWTLWSTDIFTIRTAIIATTTAHMQMLQDNPERVQSYFGDPRCAYAA